MSLLSAPTWLLVAVLLLLVVILLGPERTYQRAVGLLQAFRGTGPEGQELPTPPRERPGSNAASSDEQAA